MRIEEFEWDSWNTEHIARHEVTPEETEEVCFNKPLIFKGSKGRYYVLGQTMAGRYLTVIIKYNKGIVTVITARNMDHSERRRYQKLRR